MASRRAALVALAHRLGAPICDACAAMELGVPVEEVILTTLELDEQRDAEIETRWGICGRCYKSNRVTGLRTSS